MACTTPAHLEIVRGIPVHTTAVWLQLEEAQVHPGQVGTREVEGQQVQALKRVGQASEQN
eukprot:1157671-Pelagomonas_calceolata.AAC.1